MPRGGKRVNAGRPKGLGPHNEATKPVRIPLSLISAVQKFIKTKGHARPLFSTKVQAGTPTPADEHAELVDLNEYLMPNPHSTFFLQVAGYSMINAGIEPDDLLVVDKNLPAQSGKIVVARVRGEFTVKRLLKQNGKISLMPENPEFQPLEITAEHDCEIIGVVTNVIHKV